MDRSVFRAVELGSQPQVSNTALAAFDSVRRELIPSE